MRKFLVTTVGLAGAVVLAVSGCHHAAQHHNPPAAASFPVQPIAFDLDSHYNPCDDFADYVNAKWNKANPIPPDQTSWGAFNVLAEKSLQEQKQILETVAQDAKNHSGSELEQKLGNLYAGGMDTNAINKLGYEPIKPRLAAVDALKNPSDIVDFIDTSFNNGDSYIFDFGSGADFKDATKQIGYVSQSGLGLPAPEYYLQPQHQKIRDAYVAYIAKSLQLINTPEAEAKKQADQVMTFETELAKVSLSPTEMRDLDNQYHFVTVAQADEISPHFSWEKFFKTQGVKVGNGFSLSQPKFIAEFDRLLATAPVSQWQAYLKFNVVGDAASALSDAFQNNRFDFYGKTLGGQPEQKTRWKRVVGAVNGAMGMGLGQLYVAKYFPPEAKARAEQLVTDVRNALKHSIENLTWMSEATKKKALEKWALFLPKIGYPDDRHWRDWSGLSIKSGNWYGNLKAADKYNYHYDIDKIGKPTDRNEWQMTPQTVNAYYEPSTNTINFPAAVLQPPFYYAKGDDAVNYGGIGSVIGHESSHAFDDQGRQFDGHGNRVNWWTPEDKKRFDERTAALVRQFDGYAPIRGKPDLHVNGALTLGEDIADLGGLNIAYRALQTALKSKPGEADAKIDGFTEDQRFFLSSARIWEGTTREKAEELTLNTDPHPPDEIRAFAAASNMPQFAQAFGCKPGDPMVRTGDQLVKIW